MANVAFIGLGVMGYPMAGHLKAKGHHHVTVYNRTNAKALKWVAEHGGHSAPTPREASQGQDFVFCCVGNDDDLRAVTLGPDGAFAGMKPGETKAFDVRFPDDYHGRDVAGKTDPYAELEPHLADPGWQEVVTLSAGLLAAQGWGLF